MPLSITNCDVLLFADDATVTTSGDSIPYVEHNLNLGTKQFSRWCNKNDMIVSVPVTQVTQSPSRPSWLDYTSINGTLVPSIQRLAFPSLVVTCKFLGLSPRGVEAAGLGMLRQSDRRT